MKIGYRFCGSCNPYIETGDLLRRLMAADPENEYVYWEEGGYDKLLTISGCVRDCTTRPDFDGEIISVAGESVDCLYVPAEELCSVLLAKLRGK